MDWTSVFVEDGTEDLIIPSQFLVEEQQKNSTAPRLARLVSKVYYHHHHNHHHHHRHNHHHHEHENTSYNVGDNDSIIANRYSHRTLLVGGTDSDERYFHQQHFKRLFDTTTTTTTTTSTSDEVEEAAAAPSEEAEEEDEPVYNLKVLYYLSINYILGKILSDFFFFSY